MPPNDLYPERPKLVRVRVPTGPHELELTTTAVLYRAIRVGCWCSDQKIEIALDLGMDEIWRLWLEDIEHDTTLAPAPTQPTGPNHAHYLQEVSS